MHVAALDKTLGHVWLGAFLEENTLGESRVIEAHNSAVAAIAFNQVSSLLATCSEKGTILRIFKVADGSMLKELRRGSDQVEIRCLAFALDSSQLACSSSKGTVHVFAVPLGEDSSSTHVSSSSVGVSIEEEKKSTHEGHAEQKTQNTKSLFSMFSAVLPTYFSSEWSFAQFRIPDAHGKCALVGNNTLLGMCP